MADSHGPNQPITITLERWRWEQMLLCLGHYVNVLRGDDSVIWDDMEWADQFDVMASDLCSLVNAEGNSLPPGEPASNKGLSTANVAEQPIEYDQRGQLHSGNRRGLGWNDDENRAVIEAYFWMLDELSAEREVNKAATYRTLNEGPLHLRSVDSIEAKMQNISAVLARHDLPQVPGLKPRPNLQHDLAAAVEAQLAARLVPVRSETPE